MIYLVALLFTMFFFRLFFNDTSTPEIYTLSLHDALPISDVAEPVVRRGRRCGRYRPGQLAASRSEDHTSELQSLRHLVCRLLLEKKKKEEKPRPVVHADKRSVTHTQVVRRKTRDVARQHN